MIYDNAQQDELKKKIDELNRVAWEVRINDSDKAYKNSFEAAALSRQINYSKGLADGLTIEGFGYLRKSDFNKASSCLDEAFSIYQSSNELRGLAVVYEYKGIIHRYKGDNAAALESIFKALDFSRQTNFIDNEVTNLYQLGVTYRQLAKYDKALDYLFDSLSISRSYNDALMEAYNLHIIGSIFFETSNFTQALHYYDQGLIICKQAGDKWGEAGSLDNIGFTHFKLNNYEQAINYCNRSLAITKSTGDKKGEANALFHLAEINYAIHQQKNAVDLSVESLEIRKASGDKRGVAELLIFLAELHKLDNDNSEKTLQYLVDVLKIAEEIQANDILSKIHLQLYEFYKQQENYQEAIKQLETHINLEKELHVNTINQKIVNLEITHKAEETKREAEAIKQKNEELTRLNKEIEEQKEKVENALAELKSTQTQLLHAEKMASLGELTAGIAHEIQNPLNFVNNFSEVNIELIDEMENEVDINEIKTIANDIKQNTEKIAFHGKRADAIVKNMLQHSKKSSGIKEPTDINALCDEYLRLSYHGLRAKDKSFNADFKMYFDGNIGKINIVPQDIGRVLLNVFNNAFYAVNERKNLTGLPDLLGLVTVQTKKLNNKIEIKIEDNGNGIPSNIIDKIFQPFFTTKPTGQGTGLGLSLAYDIITKEHNGIIKAESKEGEGTTFIIMLPFN